MKKDDHEVFVAVPNLVDSGLVRYHAQPIHSGRTRTSRCFRQMYGPSHRLRESMLLLGKLRLKERLILPVQRSQAEEALLALVCSVFLVKLPSR